MFADSAPTQNERFFDFDSWARDCAKDTKNLAEAVCFVKGLMQFADT
jgi:hypothetical protein